MLALILMHNIDVMHQERNMDESIISTCMDGMEERKVVLLYIHANIDGTDKYFKCLLYICVNQHAFSLFHKI
jgi:hypothetical protein